MSELNQYERRRLEAQGRPNPLLPGVPFPLVGVDVTATPGVGIEVTDVVIRGAQTDPYGTNVEMQIAKGDKWVKGLVSWLNMGVQEDRVIHQGANGAIVQRIWCHEDFKDENVKAVKALMVAHLTEKIEKLQSFLDEFEPVASSRPRP